jgi:hypothetical protein
MKSNLNWIAAAALALSALSAHASDGQSAKMNVTQPSRSTCHEALAEGVVSYVAWTDAVKTQPISGAHLSISDLVRMKDRLKESLLVLSAPSVEQGCITDKFIKSRVDNWLEKTSINESQSNSISATK